MLGIDVILVGNVGDTRGNESLMGWDAVAR